MSNENTKEQVELIEVDLAGTVCVEHIKDVVNLFRLQIGHVVHHLVELNICTTSILHRYSLRIAEQLRRPLAKGATFSATRTQNALSLLLE